MSRPDPVADTIDAAQLTALDDQHQGRATTAPAPNVRDMALLIARLSYALKCAAPNHELPAKATAFLKKHDLIGSPLRATVEEQATVAQQQRWMALGEAVERGARDLPKGHELHVEVERDAGTVALYDGDCDRLTEFEGDTLADQINKAIDYAVALTGQDAAA
jgi:hypothetical protein